MDYDQTNLPEGYDRARDHGPEVLQLCMRAIKDCMRDRVITRILDLGCGTGRFSAELARAFNATVVGVDPSEKMLSLARAKDREAAVQFESGSAEAIPLADRSVDMVFVSMSYHHFLDPARAARECARVLREDGAVIVRTGTREHIPSYPYVRFFPSTPRLLHDTLPDVSTLVAVFAMAGLDLVESKVITQAIAPDWVTYAEKLAAGGDSILAQLSEQEMSEGLARVRGHAARHDGPVVEPIDFLMLTPPPRASFNARQRLGGKSEGPGVPGPSSL